MSGSKISLPSGAWIELRDEAEISERQRRSVRIIIGKLSEPVKALFVAAGQNTSPEAIAGLATSADLEAMFELNDAVAVALIVSWSFDLPITVDSLVDLPASDYDAIEAAAAPFIGAFMGLDTSVSPSPDSPT